MPQFISFPAARFRQRRNLGVRSRQHALSASSRSLAAGRRPHPRLRRRLSESVEGRGLPRAEGLLQALRHHHARHDDRARASMPDDYLDYVHQIDHSPLDAQSGARRGAGEAAGPQAHPHQRHAQARRRGDEAARDPPAFRGRVRHRRRRSRAQAVAASLRAVSRPPRRRSGARPRCSRISRAIWRRRTRSA